MILTKTKRLLCYGDSNTWGQSDDKNYAQRYNLDQRWTGQVQGKLIDTVEVFEEGLGGRNTDIEHYNPKKRFGNGLTYFEQYLSSHDPFDGIVIMLGTNDLKQQYNRPTEEISGALNAYIKAIRLHSANTKVLLISPIYIDSKAPKFNEYYSGVYDSNSALKSQELARSIKQISVNENCSFFDASTVSQAGKDGIHFTVESHQNLSEAISPMIMELLK